MRKMVIVPVALIALSGSSALAQLTQVQDMLIGLTNNIRLMPGDQSAGSTQNLAVAIDQAVGSAAFQRLAGDIAQIGNASGAGGLIGVTQILDSMGLQEQVVGSGSDPKLNDQELSLTAGQRLSKSAGVGSASALHQILLTGDQEAINAAGGMKESAVILAVQSSDMTGEAGAEGISANRIAVTITQSQSTW